MEDKTKAQLEAALDAAHDVAASTLALVDTTHPAGEEIQRRLGLIAAIARYRMDLRSPDERARTTREAT